MEPADSTFNSSQVIVQCHDPSNLFDKIIDKLESSLPLNKLHWKSPNRPLRSIDQLNVSFVREESRPEAATNARRHQIPGLRQTPFVKVYLAQCDDRESYKEACRKEVKQWLKGQGFSSDGKSLMKGQERHDAYEYIILHVVLPGTVAATQPKSSKQISLETHDSTDSVNSKSKWTGKSTSTVYDKLKADFSSSSKTPFERVAQVRVTDGSSRQAGALGPSETEELWQDFLEKLKTAILLSFDARVSQYEEDIREREAQRQMPGWNFCTFFILKEGLARGFENVGLIEDASTIYEELDAGLDTLVQEHASREEPDPTSALLPFSDDLKPAIRAALDDINQKDDREGDKIQHLNLHEVIELEKKNFPFDTERTMYQQRILTNHASALDFRIYIFTRQLQLHFRKARISSTTTNVTTSTNSVLGKHTDWVVIADICERSTIFITFAARALRRDLYNAWGGQQGLDEEELRTQEVVISGLVASWKWAAIMQILADCQVLHFLDDTVGTSTSSAHRGGSTQSDYKSDKKAATPPSKQELASWIGELLDMSRDILSSMTSLAIQQGPLKDARRGLQSSSLHLLYLSKAAATDLHRLLTIYTYQCFEVAGWVNASHRILHTLAQMEMERDDVEKATWWLEHIPNLNSLKNMTATDRAALKLYATCLKGLKRHDEYAQALVTLLLSAATNPISRALPRFSEETQFILNELIDVSERASETTLALDQFIAIRNIADCISHDERGVGFSLAISLSLRFNALIDVSGMELTMIPVDGNYPRINLSAPDILRLNSSATTVHLSSTFSTEGLFYLTRLTLRMGKLMLTHDFENLGLGEEAHVGLDTVRSIPIMVYPSSKAMLVNVKPSSLVDLRKPGNLSFEINVGCNDVDTCTLRIRPATAGVRLDIQAAQDSNGTVTNDIETKYQGDFNVIVLHDLAKGSRKSFALPYSTEIPTASISLKIEAQCTRSAATFAVFYERHVNINLPISVNVQDIFQTQKLFSRFTAAPASIVPLKLNKWSIEENDVFDVRHHQSSTLSLDCFGKMPASWIIETCEQESPPNVPRQLPLRVQYQTYDDLILNNIEVLFRDFIQSKDMNILEHLLLSYFLTQLPAMWTEQELETAVLLQEFGMYSYEAMKWDNILRALDATTRKSVETQLRTWHEQNTSIILTASQANIREVKLAVEMPKPSVIVSTNLMLDMHGRQFLAVGEAVSAMLILECVCKPEFEMEIQFEIFNQPEIWLIGGKKKGSMWMKSGKSAFNVIMIAQKTGHLLLPSIEVRHSQAGDHNTSSQVTFEVEGKSQTTSVLVIPNLLTTTVALGTDNMNGRHWALESQQRHIAEDIEL